VINTLEKDAAGNVWVGASLGASRYNFREHQLQGRWHLLPTELGLVKTIFASSNEEVWFGGSDQGVWKFSADTLSPPYRTIQNVYAIAEDADGKLWFGTISDDRGVFVVDSHSDLQNAKNWEVEFTTANGPASNSIVSIIRDSEGDMWLGTGDKGISKYDVSWTNFSSDAARNFDLRLDQNVLTIAQDNSSRLWLGTAGEGLRIVNLDSNVYLQSHWTSMRRQRGVMKLASNDINAIFEDSRGRFWIGKRHGI
jgi:ligand-binding sensor domain-containing protein